MIVLACNAGIQLGTVSQHCFDDSALFFEADHIREAVGKYPAG
jgi:hypothetical protein